MVAIVHLSERPDERFSRRQQQDQGLQENQPAEQGAVTGSGPPNQTLGPTIMAAPIARLMIAQASMTGPSETVAVTTGMPRSMMAETSATMKIPMPLASRTVTRVIPTPTK